MAIIAAAGSGGGTKYLHPEGQFSGVCIDIIDLGMVEVRWQGNVKQQHKVVIRFWCGEYNEEGEPLFVGERFTLSLDERSALRPFLETWRGQAFTPEELKGFDLEKLIGAPAFLQVQHRKAQNDRIYANIQAALKLPKGSGRIMPLADYVRVKDRPKDGEQSAAGAPSPFDDSDSDLPF